MDFSSLPCLIRRTRSSIAWRRQCAAMVTAEQQDTGRNKGAKNSRNFVSACVYICTESRFPPRPPRSSPHALAGRGYSMPRRTRCLARSRRGKPIGLGALPNLEALRRHVSRLDGGCATRGRLAARGPGTRAWEWLVSETSRNSRNSTAFLLGGCSLLTSRLVQEMRETLRPFGPCPCPREPEFWAVWYSWECRGVTTRFTPPARRVL